MFAHERLDPIVVDELNRRQDVVPGHALNRDLSRYYTALRQARAELREKLSGAELSAVLDVLNGHWFAEAGSVAYIALEVADACRLNGLDEKWQINGPYLVGLLQALTYIEAAALADAAERWWARVGAGHVDLEAAAALEEEPEA
jgi:hypothetical protein